MKRNIAKNDRKIMFLIQRSYVKRLGIFWVTTLSAITLYVLAIVGLIGICSYKVAIGEQNFYSSSGIILISAFFGGALMSIWLGDIYVGIESEYARIRQGLPWKKNFFGEYIE